MRFGVISALIVLLPAVSAAQTMPTKTMPTTRAGFYAAGQRFAQCSAFFEFGAKIARGASLPDNATAMEGMERGWRVAGLVLLAEGLDPSRQRETIPTFDTMKAIKIDQFKAWRELDPDNYSKRVLADYEASCTPWADLQKSIIAAMRSAPQ